MKIPTFLIGALVLAPAVLADGPPATGEPYTLQRYTIDSGGGEAGGGDYELRLTIAQPDAGGVLMGGAVDLRGGFWTGLNNADGTIFKNGFE